MIPASICLRAGSLPVRFLCFLGVKLKEKSPDCTPCFQPRLFVYVRVLQLMNLTDSRLAQAGNERLELAMLSFFEQFRKIYIGDQVQKSSKVSSVQGD